MYGARAKAYRDLQHLSDDTLRGFAREDLYDMAKLDLNNDGFLDRQEFAKVMQDKVGMDEGECKKAFELWDVDTGGTVGPHEFCAMFAIYRAEFSVVSQDAADDAMYSVVDNLIPGGICAGAVAGYFGLCCSLCTLCLSWLPMYCIAKKIAANEHDP